MGWKNVSLVQPNLYVGNIIAARSSRSLTERRISHILSVCSDPIPAEVPESGIRHMRIDVEDVDYANLLMFLKPACDFIEESLQEGGTILVHCHQGLSRSVTVVAAYLMRSRQISATRALEIIRNVREQIWPNPGFFEQLVLFELCNYDPLEGDRVGIYNNWRHKIDCRLNKSKIIQ